MHVRIDRSYASLERMPVARCLMIAMAAAVAGSSPIVAQEVTVGGQLRPRYEFRDPSPTGGDGFTSMRARATISAALERNVRVFVQIQDVRLWGSETSTLGDFQADNFDLHQGYLELRSSGSGNFAIRLGRQELNLGEQRLIGAVNWTQQARAFDGIRGSVRGDFGTVDVFRFTLGDATAPAIAQDASLIGAHASFDKIEFGTLDLYAFLNKKEDVAETEQTTLGFRFAGQRSIVTYRAEAAYQTGTRTGLDAAAYLLAARIGVSLAGGKGGVTLWYDYLSGDDDPSDNDIKVFDTLFATNHLFYGFADLFLNIPAHTGGLGLQDAALKGTYAVRHDLRVNADLHSFRLAKQGTFSSQRLGEELDVTAVHPYSPNVTFVAGISRIFAAPTLIALGRTTADMTWGFLMLNAAF